MHLLGFRCCLWLRSQRVLDWKVLFREPWVEGKGLYSIEMRHRGKFLNQLCGPRIRSNYDGLKVDFEAKKTEMKVNNSAEHINEYIEGSIKRLGSSPDLYYLHRIEPGRSLDESINALNDLKKAGKCRYIGLSECSAATLRKACAGESPRD